MGLRSSGYEFTNAPIRTDPQSAGALRIEYDTGSDRDPLLLLLGAHVPSNALNLTVIRIQSYPSDPSHQ